MLRKNTLMIALVAAAPALFLACDSTEEGSGIVTCQTDAECDAAAEICHPVGKICVPTCEMAADCPSNQKDCKEIDLGNGQKTEKKVCQCSTTPLCNEGEEGDLVCSTVDNVCETKCAADTDCADFGNRVCDTATGMCVIAGDCSPACGDTQVCNPATKTCVDKCTPASCDTAAAPVCDTGSGLCGKCTANTDCAGRADGLTECDTGSGACVAPACNPSNLTPGTAGGPDICAYGELCGTANKCVEIQNGTCSGAAGYTWDESKKGPVIAKIVAVRQASTSSTSSECTHGKNKLEVDIQFYAPNGFTHGGAADVINNRVRFKNSSGSESAAAFAKNVPSSGAKTGTFTAGLCASGSGDSAVDPSGRAVFLKDSNNNAGNIACLQ